MHPKVPLRNFLLHSLMKHHQDFLYVLLCGGILFTDFVKTSIFLTRNCFTFSFCVCLIFYFLYFYKWRFFCLDSEKNNISKQIILHIIKCFAQKHPKDISNINITTVIPYIPGLSDKIGRIRRTDSHKNKKIVSVELVVFVDIHIQK